MTFDRADYQRGATRLRAPVAHLMAVAAIEAAGENFWTIDGVRRPPVRFEAHWFSRQSGHLFDKSHPDLSSPSWRPELAARTRAGAWDQYERASQLDPVAAAEATSWGPFQIMGFHWRAMGYSSVEAFVDAMDGPDDDGQMDTFVAFVLADKRLLAAIQAGDWETWEIVYNGGGYGGAYAAKIRDWLSLHGGGDVPITPRVLQKGDRGADVIALQAALGIVADGDFGPATEVAVRAFQRLHMLVSDGMAGKMTKTALGLLV